MKDYTTNLTEKIRYSLKRGNIPPNTSHLPKEIINYWTQNFFDGNKEIFRKHLNLYGLSLSSLKDIFEMSSSKEENSDWNNALTEELLSTKKLPPHAVASSPYEQAFINICSNVILTCENAFCEHLETLITKNKNLNKKNVLSSFSSYLLERISPLLMPSLILEINLMRLRTENSFSLNDFLLSKTASRNFKEYFWKKYPVLWRLTFSVITNTTLGCSETISRVTFSRTKIEKLFKIKRECILENVSWGSGDPHNKARVVAILHFDNAKLIYKPRSLKVDKAYNSFLLWLSQQTESLPAPPTFKVLDCESYGFTEFVKKGSCAHKKDVNLFYKKLGALTAITWLLGITDLHLENLIAGSDGPYLIDLETILDPTLNIGKRKADYLPSLYYDASANLLLKSTLLPSRRDGENGVFDASAIGATGDQLTPQKVRMIENFGETNVRIAYTESIMQGSDNVPSLNGTPQTATKYKKEILSGFEETLEH